MSNESIEYYKELQREYEFVLACDDFKQILDMINKRHFTTQPIFFAYRDGDYIIENWILNFGNREEEIHIVHEINTCNKKYDFWYKELHYVKPLLEAKGEEINETVSN